MSRLPVLGIALLLFTLLSAGVAAATPAPGTSASEEQGAGGGRTPAVLPVRLAGEARQLPGYVVDGRMLVAVRPAAGLLGVAVEWQAAAAGKPGSAVIRGAGEVRLEAGQAVGWVDGTAYRLDAAPVMVNGTLYVPLRFVAEALGYTVVWGGVPPAAHLSAGTAPGLSFQPLSGGVGGEGEAEGGDGEEGGGDEDPGPLPWAGTGVAYLTFDDGPSPVTLRILEVLAEYGVRATFFMVGRQVEAYPHIARAVVAAGHIVGNHTYDHDYGRIYASAGAYVASLDEAGRVFRRILDLEPRLARAPGGSGSYLTPAMLEAAQASGYRHLDWTVPTADSVWPRLSPEQILENLRYYASLPRARPYAVVLMHDTGTHVTTAEALPALIAHLQGLGYRFDVLTPSHPLAR